MAALAAAVTPFVVLAGAEDAATDSATRQPESALATTGSQAQPAAIPRIVVRGGQPVGGVARLEYESGQGVRFTVHSDVADEVHVHGFDILKDVPANGSVRFEFPADIEGVFEVELETTHVKIAELRIEP